MSTRTKSSASSSTGLGISEGAVFWLGISGLAAGSVCLVFSFLATRSGRTLRWPSGYSTLVGLTSASASSVDLAVSAVSVVPASSVVSAFSAPSAASSSGSAGGK